MKVFYPITLDVKKTNVQEIVRTNQGEGADRELCFSLISGNQKINLTAENTVSIIGKKPDGTVFDNACNIKNGKAYYYLTTQNLAVVGDVDCQLKVVSDGVTYSAKFTLHVEEAIVPDETIESSDEFSQLVQLIQTVGKGKVYSGATNPSSVPEEYELIKADDIYIQYTSDYLIIYEATSVATTVTWTERVKVYTKGKVDSILQEAIAETIEIIGETIEETIEGISSDEITYNNNAAANMIFTYNAASLVIESFESTSDVMAFGFIPIVDTTLGDFIEIPRDEFPYTIDVSGYDAIKFRTYTYDDTGTSTVEYSLKNAVVRKKELEEVKRQKQDNLTAGNGVEINNNVVSAKVPVSSDNALVNNSTHGLWVSKTTLGYSPDFRELLASQLSAKPLASRGYVDEVALGLGNTLAVSINPTTYVMTLALKHGNEVLSTGSVDLPLEAMVVDADYDSETKEIVLTLQSGSTVRFSVADLVSGLVSTEELEEILADYLTEDEITALLAEKQDKIDSTHKLDADNVDDSESTNKFVPSHSSSESGKVLGVDNSGDLVWKNQSGGSGNPITDTAKGSTISLTDSADSPLDAISIMGKSTQNGTPSIDNPIPIINASSEVYLTSKNLITLSELTKGINISNGSIDITDKINLTCSTNGNVMSSVYKGQGATYSSQEIARSLFFPINYNVPIILSLQNGVFDFIYGIITDQNYKVIGQRFFSLETQSGRKYTPLENERFMCLQFGKNNAIEGNTYSDNIQIEIGQSETPFEFYKNLQKTAYTPILRGIPVSSGGNYTDNNNQQWLCDTIERYKDGSGKLIRRVGIVDNSTWIMSNVEPSTVGERYYVPTTALTTAPIISNYYSQSSSDTWRVEGDFMAMRTNGNIWLRCKDKVFGSASALIEWASANLVTIYGLQSADYSETPLTAEELAELDLDTYYPTTNISSNADMVVEYVCDTKNYIDKKIGELN